MSVPENESLLSSAVNCIPLHQGGEATVYLLCLKNGERLILKWYNQPFDTELVDQVEKLRVNGICKIRESGDYEEHPYQLYDYVKGISSDRLAEIPVAVALSALRLVVASLRKVARIGLSHGDLNPANVIFAARDQKDGTEFQTVLIDWGITGPGALAYAAPERFQGKAPDEKSDIFSLGMLLFRWISGENLVEASSFDQFASENSRLDSSKVSEKLFLSGKVSPEEIAPLEPLWKTTLASDPEDRAEDLEELDELLEIALEAMSGGDVALSCCTEKFVTELLPQIANVEQKVSDDLKCAPEPQFPFKKISQKNGRIPLKIAILGGIGILVLVIVFVVATGTETPNVDETGNMILKNSRSLDMDYVESVPVEKEHQDSAPVHDLLNDLPMPSKE